MDIHLGVFAHNVSDKQRKIIDEPVNFDLIAKNKYANNSEFVPDSVYKRILNKMTNYQWSFIPHSIEEMGDKDKYIRYIGLLIVPGFGVHTGIGTQPLNKKDNANATSAAKTYAFKNACKEMGLAPNIGDKLFEEDLFENDIDEGFDLTEDEEEEEPVKKPKKKAKSEPAPKKKAPKTKSKKTLSIKERIEEVRSAYELEDEDEFVAFIQIWDEDILELSDMDDDDYEEFITYLEKNKSKFEEF